MSENSKLTQTGWTIGYSSALEMGMVLNALSSVFKTIELPEDFGDLMRSIPPDWIAELASLLGTEKRVSSLIEYAAYLAGVLFEEDYGRMSLAIRELSLDDALERLTAEATSLGVAVPEGLPPRDCFVDTMLEVVSYTYQRQGFKPADVEHNLIRERPAIELAARILRDGDLQIRFWHWWDRFYYEIYQAWRKRRVPAMEEQARQAELALGARQKDGISPDISWLPAQNPLLRFPELHQAVTSGQVRVFFWVEPFGMADVTGLMPGVVIISFAEPGALYQNFMQYTGDLARRAQALGDPTRLLILRIIRQFGMINTEIAAYLRLARPTVSIHAKILREAGLIHSHDEGRVVRHEIDAAEVRRLFHDLEQFLDLPEENG
jgi:DNA-binding transcriptional ArsR family regulator